MKRLPAEFLAALEQSLHSISEQVLYGDERGFQGPCFTS